MYCLDPTPRLHGHGHVPVDQYTAIDAQHPFYDATTANPSHLLSYPQLEGITVNNCMISRFILGGQPMLQMATSKPGHQQAKLEERRVVALQRCEPQLPLIQSLLLEKTGLINTVNVPT
jgi:hypothetical protein